MAAEAGFLSQLVAHPDDETTRLVYADWLEEQGDPRADYLRREMELAKTKTLGMRSPKERELIQLRLTLDPSWVELAGMRYDLVLETFDPRYAGSIRSFLDDLQGNRDPSRSKCVFEGISRARLEYAWEISRSIRGDTTLSPRVSSKRADLLGHPPTDRGQILHLRDYLLAARQEVLAWVATVAGIGEREARWLIDRLPAPLCWLPESAEEHRFVHPPRSANVQLQLVPASGNFLAEPPTYHDCAVRLMSFPADSRLNVLLTLHEVMEVSLEEARRRARKLPLMVLPKVPWEQVRFARERFPPGVVLEIRPLFR